MAVSQQYSVIDLEKGKLDSRIYTDPGIYQDELEKVFGRAWLQVAHESLIRTQTTSFCPTWARTR